MVDYLIHFAHSINPVIFSKGDHSFKSTHGIDSRIHLAATLAPKSNLFLFGTHMDRHLLS